MSIHYGFDTLISEVKQNGGGTYHISVQRGGRVALIANEDRDGFYVAKSDKEWIVSPEEFDKFAIADYINQNAKALVDEDGLLGFWIADSGRVYFDISEHVSDFDRAIQIGIGREQLAIWDIANGKEIAL